MKQHASNSLYDTGMQTHTLLFLLHTVDADETILPLVTGNDVDGKASVKGFESSFIGGSSDKKQRKSARRLFKGSCCYDEQEAGADWV